MIICKAEPYGLRHNQKYVKCAKLSSRLRKNLDKSSFLPGYNIHTFPEVIYPTPDKPTLDWSALQKLIAKINGYLTLQPLPI